MNRSKVAIADSVLVLHSLLGLAFSRYESDRRVANALTPATEAAYAEIIFQPPVWDKTEIPEVQLETVPITPNSINLVESDDDALFGIIGSSSAPRLRRFQSVDETAFARRAGLVPGQPKTVVLVADIGEDGRPNNVNVVQGSAIPAVDGAAVDYALALRWIPGTRNREPLAMRIRFSVTLVVSL
jgi:hypothetical protein